MPNPVGRPRRHPSGKALRTTFRLSPASRELLKRLAAKLEWSQSEVVERAVYELGLAHGEGWGR